jgi:hypothetical protein
MPARRRVQLVLVKPSHHDDDGYVIRRWRAIVRSNSLAAVFGIAADCAERKVAGPEVAIDPEAIVETHTRVNGIDRAVSQSQQFWDACIRWLPVEPISARPSISPATPHRRRSGRSRRISRVRLCRCLTAALSSSIHAERSKIDSRALLRAKLSDLGVSTFAGQAESRFELVFSPMSDRATRGESRSV